MMPRKSSKSLPYRNQVDLNVAFTMGGWPTMHVLSSSTRSIAVLLFRHATNLGRGTSLGRSSVTGYERARDILDARVIRIAVTARF